LRQCRCESLLATIDGMGDSNLLTQYPQSEDQNQPTMDMTSAIRCSPDDPATQGTDVASISDGCPPVKQKKAETLARQNRRRRNNGAGRWVTRPVPFWLRVERGRGGAGVKFLSEWLAACLGRRRQILR
jgi:hypothetical protein